ncbi:TPA: hypothetical protein ACNUVO_002815 [Aeromonas salmonicida subsp. pectinolytica]
MKFKKVAILLLVQPIMFGCSDEHKLNCNAEETKSTATQIMDNEIANIAHSPFVKHIIQSKGMPSKGEIENIKAVSIDEKIGAATCSATYKFSFGGINASTEFTYDLNWLQDKKTTEVKADVQSARSITNKVFLTLGPIVEHERRTAEMAAYKKRQEQAALEAQQQPVSVELENANKSEPELTPSQQQCVNTKMDDYRVEVGQDALISYDQISEWEGQCRGN